MNALNPTFPVVKQHYYHCFTKEDPRLREYEYIAEGH